MVEKSPGRHRRRRFAFLGQPTPKASREDERGRKEQGGRDEGRRMRVGSGAYKDDRVGEEQRSLDAKVTSSRGNASSNSWGARSSSRQL